jgi:hypothetical protein
MKRVSASFAFLFSLTTLSGCNLFSWFASSDVEGKRKEDISQALASGKITDACRMVKGLQVDGLEPVTQVATVGPYTQKVHDALIETLFADPTFFASLSGSNSTGAACAFSRISTGSACQDVNCLAITNSCTHLLANSQFNAISNVSGYESLKCIDAYTQCSKLQQYYGSSNSQAAVTALIDCKTAMEVVMQNAAARAACPEIPNSICADREDLAALGPSPCGDNDNTNGIDDVCDPVNCTTTTNYDDITSANYSYDPTFFIMSNPQASCN